MMGRPLEYASSAAQVRRDPVTGDTLLSFPLHRSSWGFYVSLVMLAGIVAVLMVAALLPNSPTLDQDWGTDNPGGIVRGGVFIAFAVFRAWVARRAGRVRHRHIQLRLS